MKTVYTFLVAVLAGACVAAETTNTLVTAKLTAHRMTGAGSMEPGGGFYSYETSYVVASPTNFAGVVLIRHSLGSGPDESETNALVTVRMPTALLDAARANGKPCQIEATQITNKTESNKASEATPVRPRGRGPTGAPQR